jgi:hypothetical protein
MANFAKISENNIVLQILYIEEKYILDENGEESETIGQQYLEKHNNWPAHLWIKTTNAGIGYTFDPIEKKFWPPKPFPSWVKTSNGWISPVGEKPGKDYFWNENNQSWDIF